MLVEAGSQPELYQPAPMFGHGHTQDQTIANDQLGPSNVERANVNDIMTYSQYVNGSIFSIPKQWSQQSTDDLLVTVYSFIKTYLG